MDRKERRKILGTSLAVGALYNLGLFSFFYAVPLQLAASTGKRKHYGAVALLSSLLILGLRYVLLRAAGFPELILLDAAVVLTVAPALYAAAYPLGAYSLPLRMGIIAAAAGILLLLTAPFGEALDGIFQSSLGRLGDLMITLPGSEGAADTAPVGAETLYLMMKDIFARTGIAVFFFFLCFSRWAGSRLYLRMHPGEESREEDWSFPESGVWLLFLPLTLFLFDRLMGRSGQSFLRGIPAYAVFNLLFVMSGLFSIKGLGIVNGFLKRSSLPRRTGRLFLPILGMAAFMPGLNLILLVAFAGLGVSGLWVNYRIFDKE